MANEIDHKHSMAVFPEIGHRDRVIFFRCASCGLRVWYEKSYFYERLWNKRNSYARVE